MSTDGRERLISNLSWWAGWCLDNESVLPDLVVVHGLLLDAKHRIALDREESR